MNKYSEKELELLAIQIGCVIRLARLKANLSQEDLSYSIGSDSISVGRIERAEHISGWDKLLLICQQLKVDYCKLFILKNKRELLLIIDKSFNLEKKLNQDKRDFYSFLKKNVSNKFDSLS